MKKRLDKALWGLIMVITLTATLATGTFFSGKKAAYPKHYAQAVTDEELEVDLSKPRVAERTSAIKVYYYRVFNGWLQRRLWNRTLGKWEWSTWHDVKRSNSAR